MKQVNLSEAGPRISGPVAQPVQGEDVERPRLLGLFKGQVHMSDDFDQPLEEFAPYL